MRSRSIPLLLSLLLVTGVAAPAVEAGPYEVALCPVTGGRFVVAAGQLWIEITKQHGRPVEKRREKIANPLDERSHQVLSERGAVTVEAHPDKDGRGLFIHWGTLRDGQ